MTGLSFPLLKRCAPSARARNGRACYHCLIKRPAERVCCSLDATHCVMRDGGKPRPHSSDAVHVYLWPIPSPSDGTPRSFSRTIAAQSKDDEVPCRGCVRAGVRDWRVEPFSLSVRKPGYAHTSIPQLSNPPPTTRHPG